MELQSVKLLRSNIILKEWWPEVKENFWEKDAKEHIKMLLKELMEHTMIEEIQQTVQSGETVIYRNGYYERDLVSQFGNINDIRVPRLRNHPFKTQVFKRYQRHQDVVKDLIEDVFLAGVSTRRVGQAVSKLLETKVSAGTVSRITRRLDSQVRLFHQRPLIDEYQYLILDGICLKIRHNLKYHNRMVLAAYGITVFGQKHLIDFTQAKGESREAWEGLLQNLFQRGLHGKNLKLIVMDGSKGLKAGVEFIYPHVKIQRCWAHKMRNVSGYCLKKYEKGCVRQAQKIYLAQNHADSMHEFKRWKNKWEKLCPKAVGCLEKDLDDLLVFHECPKSHQIKVRTTNAIERSFREVRRRTKVFSCFSNRASSERIIYAIFTHLNNSWKNKPLKEFTQFI